MVVCAEIEKKPEEVPNAETIAAMKEADDMINHPERYKTFSDMDDLIKELEE